MSGDTIQLEIDRSRCVLCGAPNECVMARRSAGEDVADPCWCVERSFPEAITKLASERDGGASCICASCLENKG